MQHENLTVFKPPRKAEFVSCASVGRHPAVRPAAEKTPDPRLFEG